MAVSCENGHEPRKQHIAQKFGCERGEHPENDPSLLHALFNVTSLFSFHFKRNARPQTSHLLPSNRCPGLVVEHTDYLLPPRTYPSKISFQFGPGAKDVATAF